MVGQQQLDAREVFVAHDLVGDQRAARAGGHAHGQLRDGGKGQAPGASIELALEQLRRHGGLAVRRQVDAPFAHARLHPLEVVFERLALEHGQRQRQVAGQHVPAGGADFAAQARRLGARVALEAVAEQRVDEVVGGGQGVHWSSRFMRVVAWSWNTAEPALPGRRCCPLQGGWRSDTKCAKTGGES
ncbi:hypothetical protein D3C87_1456460 [compost metagenome]